MSEQDLAQLLHDATPQPPVSIEFDQIAARVRRRHRSIVTATVAGTLLVIGAAASLPMLLEGDGTERLVPAGPTTRATAPSTETPPAVLEAAGHLRSDVIASGPLTTIWVTMTWGQWQRLDGSFTDPPGHNSDPVYVVQIRSDTEMTCRSCKGLHPAAGGRFATLVVPQHAGDDIGMFTMGNTDFGLSRRHDVRTIGSDTPVSGADSARKLCEQALGSAVSAASASIVGDARSWEMGGPPPTSPSAAAERKPARNAWPTAKDGDPAAWCTTGTGGNYTFYAVGPDGTAVRLEAVNGLGPTPPASPFPVP
jgi:hypothetical protein